MEKRVEDLSHSELGDYLNRIVEKHQQCSLDRVMYVAGAAGWISLTERMKSLERLFHEGRALAEQRGWIVFFIKGRCR